ncbi:uncharacterized protein LOC132267148 isoform X3 [Cornus florida]|uniref:uncharacterized protein LOC132267148 isoform X3 n=1 Tax=Cornus florida TaxID=4283 RepID=UPI00289A694B|nr:uncharacterized protein LOC132267148 isoform X3 [Cornus florida]
MDYQLVKKPRILCLHGFRSSSAILKKELEIWPEFVLNMMDLVFLDAPFPAEGEPSGEGKFPPYYEWFESNEDHSEYRNFDECVAYIEDCMVRLGPFDGLLGLSQGALLAAALPGMQKHYQGVNLEVKSFLPQRSLKMPFPLLLNAHHSTS